MTSIDIKKFEEQQNKNLRLSLKLALNTKFYRNKFKNLRIDINKIKTTNDLPKLPLTVRNDLYKSDDFLAVPKNKIARIQTTSGTTGESLIIYQSFNDIKKINMQRSRIYKIIGLKQGDCALSLFPYGLTPFFVQDVTLLKMGLFVIQCGSRKETSIMETVNLVIKLKPNVLLTSPSFALRLADVASEMGVLNQLQFEKIILSSEHVNKKIIREKFKKAEIFSLYASSDARVFAFECKEHIGYHIIQEDNLLEVIDPKTGEKIDEGKGELVVTIPWEAIPLIRYRTGDLVYLNPYYRCKCGISSPLIKKIFQRTDELVKIRGNLVSPSKMIQVLNNFEEIDDFLIVVKKINGLDELSIKIKTNKYNIKNKVIKEIQERFNITPVIKLVKVSINPPEFKAKHFVDKRGRVEK